MGEITHFPARRKREPTVKGVNRDGANLNTESKIGSIADRIAERKTNERTAKRYGNQHAAALAAQRKYSAISKKIEAILATRQIDPSVRRLRPQIDEETLADIFLSIINMKFLNVNLPEDPEERIEHIKWRQCVLKAAKNLKNGIIQQPPRFITKETIETEVAKANQESGEPLFPKDVVLATTFLKEVLELCLKPSPERAR